MSRRDKIVLQLILLLALLTFLFGIWALVVGLRPAPSPTGSPAMTNAPPATVPP